MAKIYIKPKNRGKFNATKKETGKTTEELTHSKNPVTRKRAIFAQNAAKWNHKDLGGGYDAPGAAYEGDTSQTWDNRTTTPKSGAGAKYGSGVAMGVAQSIPSLVSTYKDPNATTGDKVGSTVGAVSNAAIGAIPGFGQYYGMIRGAGNMIQGFIPEETKYDRNTGQAVTVKKTGTTGEKVGASFDQAITPAHEHAIDSWKLAGDANNTKDKVKYSFQGLGDITGLTTLPRMIAAGMGKDADGRSLSNIGPMSEARQQDLTFGIKENGGSLERYNLGSHGSMNPNFSNTHLDNKGVQIEKNETIFRKKDGGDYVFSDNPNMLNPNTGNTFAKDSKLIDNKTKKPFFDKASLNTKKYMLNELQQVNDVERANKETKMNGGTYKAENGLTLNPANDMHFDYTNYSNPTLDNYVAPNDYKWNGPIGATSNTPFLQPEGTFAKNAPNTTKDKTGFLGNLTTGDKLQLAGMIPGTAYNLARAFEKPEKQKLYTDKSPITQQQVAKNFNPAYLAYNAAKQGINEGASSDAVRRAALIESNSNLQKNVMDYSLNVDNTNKGLRSNYEDRLSNRNRFNIGQNVMTDDVNARNRAAQRAFGAAAASNLGQGLTNTGQALNQSKSNEIGYSALQNLASNFQVDADTLGEFLKTKGYKIKFKIIMAINRYDVPATLPQNQQYFQLPFNEIATGLMSKQKQQDDALKMGSELGSLAAQIKSLDPSVPGAENDRTVHQSIVNDLNSAVSSLYGKDLTNPENKKELYNVIGRAKSYFGPNGEATKLNERYNQYNSKVEYINKDKVLEDRPDLKNYAISSLKVNDFNSPLYNKIDSYGYHAPIADKEIQSWADDTLKSVAETTLTPAQYKEYSLKGFNYLTELKQTDGKTYNKIFEAMASRVPKSYLQSAAQDALVNGRDPNQELDIFSRDEKGNVRTDNKGNILPNYNSYLGRVISGTAKGGAYMKEDYKLQGYQDDEALAKAKHKIDNPIANYIGTTEGIEIKPASGNNPTDMNAYKQVLSSDKDSILNPYIDKFFPNMKGVKTIDDVLALSDEELNNAGISRDLVLQDKNKITALEREQNIVEQRDKNLENQALSNLNIKADEFYKSKDKLPALPGFNKDEIIDALNYFNAQKNKTGEIEEVKVTPLERLRGKTSYRTYNGDILTPDRVQRFTKIKEELSKAGVGQTYEDFLAKNGKVLKEKNKLMDSQMSIDNTFSAKIPNINPELSDKIYETINKFAADPYAIGTFPLTSASPELNGKTFQELVNDGTIDDINQVKISKIGFTKQPLSVDPKTGNPELGIRLGISIADKDGKKAKPYEVIISTNNLTTPELKEALQDPRLTSTTEYNLARREGVNKGNYTSKDYKNFNVRYNLGNNTINILGIELPETKAFEVLGAIEGARQQGFSDSNILNSPFIKNLNKSNATK